MNQKTLIAYHEAGHVIIALVNSCYVSKAVVYSNCGQINYFRGNSKIWANKEAQISYAGTLSEQYLYSLVYTDKFPQKEKQKSKADFSSINYLSKKYSLNKSKILLNTRKKIKKYWKAIIVIANNLLKLKKLKAADIFKILKSLKSKFWNKKIKFLTKNFSTS